MGIQDDLAVVAAGRALAQAGLGNTLGERAGLYAAIGFIPFDQAEIDRVVAASLDEQGDFSMAKFSAEGIARAHPLLTFRCLPNMPAYHVSVSFDVQGPYLVGYPGPGQLHQAIEEAVFALAQGEIDCALVIGVAHQRNFLVTHHFARIDRPVDAARLRDAGTCLVLEREDSARARGAIARARPREWSSPRRLDVPRRPWIALHFVGLKGSTDTEANLLNLSRNSARERGASTPRFTPMDSSKKRG